MYYFISYALFRRVLLLAVAVCLIAIAPGSAAEKSADPTTLSLEELLDVKVYSASKYEQKATEAPSSISVITAEEINRYGYRTIGEALQSLPGFYMMNHGTYSSLGVRGFSPAEGRILILVNGHSINDNINNSAPLGNDFPIDMDLIQRIEVVPGPSSSLYGGGAFFGVVNVITRTGKDTKGAVVSGEAGNLSTYKTTGMYGFDTHGTQALFSATYWDTAAPGHLDGTADPVGSLSSHDQSRRAFALVSSHGFTLQASASALAERMPTSAQACGACHQASSGQTNFRGYIDLQYEHPVWKGVQLTARTYYDTTAYHGGANDLRTCDTSSCHGQVIDHDIGHGDWAGAELKLTRRFLDKHRVTVGAEYRDNFRQAQQNYIDGFVDTHGSTSTSMTFVNYNRTSGIWGLYGEGEFRLHRKLILNAGVRNDRYNYFGDTTNPRVALIYSPLKRTSFKYIFGTAFRVPSFSELYYAAGPVFQSAPTLQPETIRTQEGVWEQQLSKRVTMSVAGFYNHIGRYISEEITPTGMGVFVNTSSANAKGGELQFKGKLSSNLEGRMSYTLQDARDGVTGASLPDAPRHLVKVNVSTPVLRRKLVPAIEAQYMSGWLTQIPGGYAAPPVLLNANLSTRQLWGGLSFSGGAYNLLGRPMGEPTVGYIEATPPENFVTLPASSLLPADGRSLRFKMTWTSQRERPDKEKPKTHAAEGTL